jgi:transcription termination/antitermination protein NusA
MPSRFFYTLTKKGKNRMNKDLVAIFEYMEREKGVQRATIIHAIEESLTLAANKSLQGGNDVTVKIDPKTGIIEAHCEKEVVEEITIPTEEILLKDALELSSESQLGEFIQVPLDPKLLGRIAAQKARQIISQKLKSAERDVICEEYRHRINDLVSGTIKRFVRGSDIIVDLGKVEALLPAREYPKTERYRSGEKILALLYQVKDNSEESAEVILSRSQSEFVKQLFIQEVPEIQDGTVVIKNIVREAGYRTKIVVESQDSQVDPVGACIGMRGTRVKNIVRELNNEKIDIIPIAEDPVELLQNALAPIQIRKLGVSEDESVLSIVVDDDDLAVVIGKKGMNARLNGALIGKELEVQRLSEYNRAMILERTVLAESDDKSLDLPIKEIEGINSLLLQNIIESGYDTPRKILKVAPGELADIPGISLDMADLILDQIRKKRA